MRVRVGVIAAVATIGIVLPTAAQAAQKLVLLDEGTALVTGAPVTAEITISNEGSGGCTGTESDAGSVVTNGRGTDAIQLAPGLCEGIGSGLVKLSAKGVMKASLGDAWGEIQSFTFCSYKVGSLQASFAVNGPLSVSGVAGANGKGKYHGENVCYPETMTFTIVLLGGKGHALTTVIR